MLSLILKNKEILVLILIIVGGIYYFIKSGNRVSLFTLGEIDFHCSDVHVPSEIKYNDIELFCSCVRMSNSGNIEQRQQRCLAKFSKKD